MAFYRFLSLTTVPQPPNSNWCWAACAQQMIQGLGIRSNIGETQHEILTYYKNNFPPVGLSQESYHPSTNTCPKPGEPMTAECDRGLHPEHVEAIFEQMGIHCHPLTDLSQLLDLPFLEDTLTDTDAPIILHIYKSERHHMVLITGYGKRNNCDYLCISDPVSKEDDRYLPLSSFSINQVVSAWVCEIDKKSNAQENLKKDRLYFDLPDELYKRLIDLLEKNRLDLRLVEMAKVPKSLIANQSINNPKIAQEYLISNRSLQSFFSSPFPGKYLCPAIPIGATLAYDILDRLIKEITKNNFRDSTLYFEYSSVLGISALHHIDEHQISSYPLEAPLDAAIEKKWQPLHHFLKSQTKVQPLHYFD